MLSGQIVQERTAPRRAVDQALPLLAGVVALTISAKIRIPLPFTLVPITGQTLAVLLVGALLGRSRGAAAAVAYLSVGALGAPIFAYGGGMHYLLGPTGGYLLGLVPAAWLAGALVEAGTARRVLTLLPALALADALLFAFGLAWLALYVPLPLLLGKGLVPFLPGEALKLALAAIVLRRGLR